MAVPIEELRGIPLFDKIDDRARRLLAAEVEARSIKPGDVVFRAGEPSHAVYIVQKGAVEVSVEDEQKQRLVLYTARRGELFGELTLHQSPRASTGTAVEAGEVIELDRHDLRLLFRDSAETAIAVLEAIGEQTKRADAMLCNHTSLNVNAQFAEDQGWSERIADAISAAAGSMPSALFHVLWFGAWIVANTLPVGIPHWDPFPFGLLTMIVSLEAIFLSVFVLLSQNRATEKDRMRAEVDYQVNVRAELEVSLLHDKHDRLYAEVMEKLTELTERRS
jgi:CRP/FNR family transcriptional regulator, cyclic AMP receptor protein